MKKPGAWIAACCLCLIFTACTDTNDTTQDPSAPADEAGSAPVSQETLPSEQPSADVPTDPNTRVYRDCTITILEHDLHLDIDGDPAIRIAYQFTNNSEAPASFGTIVIPHAYQGTPRSELRYTSPSEPDDAYASTLTVLDPGESIICAGYFKLISEDLPVELDIKDLRDSSADALHAAFDITSLPIQEPQEITETPEQPEESEESSNLLPSKKKKK